jgi:hypothetical protein
VPIKEIAKAIIQNKRQEIILLQISLQPNSAPAVTNITAVTNGSQGQNKCQTLDGFSASEPCSSGGSHRHSKHSTHNSGTTDTSSTTIPTTSGTSSSGEFIQLPTNRSDFSNGDDVNSIRLVFVHGGNSPIGGWLLRGMVQNVGNKTIPMPTLIATIYNAALKPVASMQQPAIVGSDTALNPGQQKPFELYGNVATGVYFKLGYDW